MLPNFSNLSVVKITTDINKFIHNNQQQIKRLTRQSSAITWDNFFAPLELIDNELNNYWAKVSHINSVQNNSELRQAYNECLPKLSAYATEIKQNKDLFTITQNFAQSPQFASLNLAQQQVINNSLRDFKLSGIDLLPQQQQRFKQINLQLSKLTSKFNENILDTTNQWQKNITEVKQLSGIPQNIVDLAQQLATDNQQSGFTLTLDFPTYHAVMTYAENRQLRAEFYKAYMTKGATTGCHDKKHDNSKIMVEILQLKSELAQILAFDSYTDLSLVTKMATEKSQVMEFLNDLLAKSLLKAQQEFDKLRQFSQLADNFSAWDTAFYAEKLQQKLFNFTAESLKPWLPVTKVLAGLFNITETLFKVKITEINNKDVWHPEVKVFKVTRLNGDIKAYFYLDLYARKNKCGGAWMDVCREQITLGNGELQIPIAYLTCNFTPPLNKQPALLTHDELVTLFHEFGHGLHHMLSEINIPSVGGINGVPWDAVELPSQLMENFCWQAEVLPMISGHFETDEPLPNDKLTALLAAKNFNSALAMVRHLEFALFDFELHSKVQIDAGTVEYTLAEVKTKTEILKLPAWVKFANSFSHIFAGGYAAGYYSYKWAEVLSADAFALFEQQGILSASCGENFLTNILQKGGSEDFMDLFVKFRGRQPKIDALLRHNEI